MNSLEFKPVFTASALAKPHCLPVSDDKLLVSVGEFSSLELVTVSWRPVRLRVSFIYIFWNSASVAEIPSQWCDLVIVTTSHAVFCSLFCNNFFWLDIQY
ncbi:hypothetical protein BZZ01_06410 [Nostocales cyanobacterium HT-58-2]|nr:hypothetical protein BZZ01_06410 [Nostocales cyanobacterium HT-58-2]